MSYQQCPCLESTKKDLEGIKNQFETLIANIKGSSCPSCAKKDGESEKTVSRSSKGADQGATMLPCRWYEKKDTEIEKDREHKQSIAEMENFYKTELDKVRSDLEAERKKHDSFKQRMASELSPEIESRGDLSEDITNPCRETTQKDV
ncbi:uncharacterized protein [Oncorhynchus clarkii lewisi]|uniref:uncharacterized protein isoform X2 n=1 Tax=Oncorhynchus clarkii lewisi TaxID=490388 RepID=UPI0039B95A5E